MNRIKSHLKMHYLNSKKSFVIFWSIMFAISALGILISIYFKSRGYESVIITNSIVAVVIFGAVSGMVCYNETLPYMLNMGITRKDFIFGFAIYNILLSLIMSVIYTLLSIWEWLMYKLLGFNYEHFGQFFSGVKGIFEMTWICFLVTLCATVLFTLIASIYYKKGMMFLFGIGALIMLLMFIPGVTQAVFGFLESLVLSCAGGKGYIMMTLYSLAFFLLCYLIIYPLARTSQIKR
ncbi:hypothetical protein [Lutispora thermophila]|uniref:ABC-2 family transporter protein n=1 Tax=Lutispora thermophila DSM 19022 TaxID=1122184 RepID=A0A1M6E2V9_9FIRM|nr:hypothetical protein [Lutispora thermophila]SHI79847.1 hypothetical protein SAMN02745176_01386 [Lutispora thermophila DSM 19022]